MCHDVCCDEVCRDVFVQVCCDEVCHDVFVQVCCDVS